MTAEAKLSVYYIYACVFYAHVLKGAASCSQKNKAYLTFDLLK